MAAATKTTPVLLNYDYWDANGERHAAGETISLPVDEAKKLLGEKKAERADPLPGED